MNSENFNLGTFKYIDEKELPVIVLGISIQVEYPRKFIAKKDFYFKKIVHQTSGHACNQHYIYGVVLTPKNNIVKNAIKAISDEWLDSDMGCFGVTLSETLKYREQINKTLGVDCNASFQSLEEAFYPIDYSKENLERLSSKKIPDNLDDMLEWKDNMDRVFGCINRWGIYILGENCD